MCLLKKQFTKNKGWEIVINIDESKSVKTHCRQLYMRMHIPKEIQIFLGNKIIITNIYRIQAYDSIMCIIAGCIDFMFKGKSLLD